MSHRHRRRVTPLSSPRLKRETAGFARAHVSSGCATAVNWVMVATLVPMAVHYLTAAAVGAVSGGVTDFMLKRHWAFHRVTRASMRREGSRYAIASSTSLLWNMAASHLMVGRLHLPAVPGVIAASVLVGIAWNYPMHRFFVFGHGHDADALETPDALIGR
jgi:putative flippase GtrA